MQRRSHGAARNKLDLSDRVQVRIVRKRLKVSEQQLAGLVQKAGSSIAAVRKEAGARRLLTLPRLRLPPANDVVESAVAEEEAAQV